MILFYDHKEASDIACRYERSYFNEMNALNRRIRKYNISCNELGQFCIPWTFSYKQRINQGVQYLNGLNLTANWSLLNLDTTWRFLLVNNEYEGGLPHTLGNVIVLPEKIFQMEMSQFYSILFHEKIHTLQKSYSYVFHRLYTNYWSFRKLEKASINQLLLQEQRANPDTPELWEINSWIPIVKFRPTAQTLTDVDFYLVQCNENGIPIRWELQQQIPWYRDLVGNNLFCYHPDEICAVLLTKLYLHPDQIPSGLFASNLMLWLEGELRVRGT